MTLHECMHNLCWITLGTCTIQTPFMQTDHRKKKHSQTFSTYKLLTATSNTHFTTPTSSASPPRLPATYLRGCAKRLCSSWFFTCASHSEEHHWATEPYQTVYLDFHVIRCMECILQHHLGIITMTSVSFINNSLNLQGSDLQIISTFWVSLFNQRKIRMKTMGATCSLHI